MLHRVKAKSLLYAVYILLAFFLAGCHNHHHHKHIPPNSKINDIQVALSNGRTTNGFSENTLAIGNQQKLEATVVYEDESTQDVSSDVTWTSTDPKVISVSESGLVQAISKGEASITANIEGVTSDNKITFVVTDTSLVSIDVTPKNLNIPAGIEQQLTATGTYTDGSTANITNNVQWQTNDSSVASITESGYLTAHKTGDVQITATRDNISNKGPFALKVTSATLNRIQVTAEKESIAAGYKIQLTATGIYSDDSRSDLTNLVTWNSSEDSIANIDATGVLTAKQEGNTSISATLNGAQSNTKNFTITSADLNNIQISSSTQTIAKGETLQLTATGQYSDQSTADLTNHINWISDNPSIATVSTTGLVTGSGQGTTTIRSNINGVESEAPFTININPAKIVSVQVTPASSSIAVGNGEQMVATATYSDGTTADISAEAAWTETDNTGVNAAANAVVVDISQTGYAKGLNSGGAHLTATLDGITNQDEVGLSVTPAVLNSIQITPPIDQIAKGVNQQMHAEGIYSDQTTVDLTKQVTWLSKNQQVASITQSGELQAVEQGVVTISASYNGVSSGNPLSINVTTATLDSITITPAEPKVAVGVKQKLTATGHYTDGTNADLSHQVSWINTDPTVASISPQGMQTGLNEGSTTITASYNGVSSPEITSSTTAAELTDIEIIPEEPTLALGTDLQLQAIGTYSDGSEVNLTHDVSWTSASSQNATVTAKGIITGAQKGTSDINATFEGVTTAQPSRVTVTDATLKNIQVTPEDFTLAAGTEQKITAIGAYTDGTTQDLTKDISWVSTDPNVATVTPDGKVQSVKEGKAVISATYQRKPAADDITLDITLTVKQAKLTAIEVTPADIQLAAGLEQQLNATAIYSDGTTTQDVTHSVAWSSTEPTIVSITPNGLAKGLGIGTAELTATLNGKKNSDNVDFDVTGAELNGITITSTDANSPDAINMDAGDQQPLHAIGSYSDGSEVNISRDINWKSSNTAVATVTPYGLVEGISEGTANITGNLNGVETTAFSVSITAQQRNQIRIIPKKGAETVIKGRKDMYAQTVDENGKKLKKINHKANWTTDDPTIATVHINGEVTGVSTGKTIVRITYEGMHAQAPITIINPVLQKVNISVKDITKKGIQLLANGTYDNGKNYNINDSVSWVSKDTNIATVTKSGQVKLRKKGVTTTISATMDGITGTIQVPVQ